MQPANRRHIALAIGLWVAVLGSLIAWQAHVQLQLAHGRAELADKDEMLAKLRQQPVVRADVAVRRSGETLHAQTSTVAASEFQKLVQQSVAGAGSVLHSVQSDSEEMPEAGGQVKVALQVVFDGTIEAVQKVLFQLETGVPYVFVDAVTIRPDSTLKEQASTLLRVTLNVSSYWRNGEGSQ